MKLLFSTDGVQPARRFSLFQDFVASDHFFVDHRKVGDAPFARTIQRSLVAPLMLDISETAACTATVGTDRLRNHAFKEHLAIFVLLSGTAWLRQGERSLVQGPGDIFIVDERRHVAEMSDDCKHLIVFLPRARIERELGSSRSFSALLMRATQPLVVLARTYLLQLASLADGMGEAEASRAASIAIDLLVAATAEHVASQAPGSTQQSVVVERAKAYIELQLGSASLDTAEVAGAVGVSIRHLQELFARADCPVMEWIWERRLRRARKFLSDMDRTHIQIGYISYLCGFANQAHFSRRFRDRWGLTPSDWRRQMTARQGQIVSD